MTARLRALCFLALVVPLVVAGAALVLGGSEEAPGHAARSTAAELDPGVAVRVSASGPGTVDPALLARFVTASGSAAVAATVSRVKRALASRRIDLARGLLAAPAWISLTLERSCPPPAMLDCRPAVRLCARLRAAPSAPFQRRLRAAVLTGLQAGGLRRLTAHRDRVSSGEETLARWRLDGDLLELSTGWLPLGGCATPAAGSEAAIRVERDPQELALLFGPT